VRSRWSSGRALTLHLTVLVVVSAFALLARWQVHRALSGNTLSWAYAFEWPFFALYAIYMWWKLLHDTEENERRPAPQSAEEAAALEEYNRWLAGLNQSDRRR
jgi:DNA-binding transcriptional regulator of glucitol operon